MLNFSDGFTLYNLARFVCSYAIIFAHLPVGFVYNMLQLFGKTSADLRLCNTFSFFLLVKQTGEVWSFTADASRISNLLIIVMFLDEIDKP